MAASSAGSSTAFAFALLTISCLVVLLLRHYLPLRTTPAYLLFPVFLAIFLPASIILLVPVDLATNAVEEDGTARGISLSGPAIQVLWRISYWLTFVLTWLILPLLGEYADSGHREPRARMIYSLRSNAKYQLVVLGCATAGLVYFFYENGFVFSSLKSLVMALAYAWGLVLAIYLMGHGLVAVPRRLYRGKSISGRLRHLETQAPKVHERLVEAFGELDDLEGQVLKLRQRKNGTARNFQDWIEELVESSDLPESRIGLTVAARDSAATIPTVITERYMADLTRKLKRARHKRIRFVEEWDRLIREARDCQNILNATGSRSLDSTRHSTSIQWLTRFSPLTPRTRFYLHAKILPLSRLILSFVLAGASVCIIWSEVFEVLESAFPAIPELSVVGLSIIHHPNSTSKGKIGFGGQIMASAWLLYMCAAALFSITEVKIWGNRALVTRHTYAESACWYASLVARLTVPLAFNFTTLIPPSISHNMAFYKLLGRSVDLTPLGNGFSDYFPIFILVPVIATSFNLYSKVRNFAGFGAFEDDANDASEFGAGGWREARDLIECEWNGTSASTHALGLSSPRPRSPLPPAERYTDGFSSQSQTSLGASAAASAGRTADRGTLSATAAPAAPSPTDRHRVIGANAQSQAQSNPRARAAQEQRYRDEPGEGNFFEDFAHRVRNTFDTAETPEWIAKIPKPKWMGGGGNGGGGGSTSSSSAGRGGNSGDSGGGGPFGRFFSEGGLRL